MVWDFVPVNKDVMCLFFFGWNFGYEGAELEKLSTNMVMKHDVSPLDDLLRLGS